MRDAEEASMPERSQLQRAVLPIPDVTPDGLTTYNAKDPDTSYPPIEPLRPPAGAPNVLIVLIDDCGFGATSAFGGPVQWVQIDIDEAADDADHQLDPNELLRVTMARQ
jgi:hypothetical protein